MSHDAGRSGGLALIGDGVSGRPVSAVVVGYGLGRRQSEQARLGLGIHLKRETRSGELGGLRPPRNRFRGPFRNR